MATTINNNWITLTELYKGVTVQRKFAGLDTFINEFDEVEYCKIKYWQRELYPNGEVIKTELKWYTLEDLPYTELEVDGVMKYMDALPVLTGFIMQLGAPYIITPARDTIENSTILPFGSHNGYPLRKDTRPLNDVPQPPVEP